MQWQEKGYFLCDQELSFRCNNPSNTEICHEQTITHILSLINILISIIQSNI